MMNHAGVFFGLLLLNGASADSRHGEDESATEFAKGWLSVLQSRNEEKLADTFLPTFVAAGFDLPNGALRKSCVAIGEEREKRSFSIRVSTTTPAEARLLAKCLIADGKLMAVLPVAPEPWSGSKDRKGRQATLRVVKGLPKELRAEANNLSKEVAAEARRFVELRATDNRGISVAAVLVVEKTAGKARVAGLLMESRFEE
jgi:hypothetical protein